MGFGTFGYQHGLGLEGIGQPYGPGRVYGAYETPMFNSPWQQQFATCNTPDCCIGTPAYTPAGVSRTNAAMNAPAFPDINTFPYGSGSGYGSFVPAEQNSPGFATAGGLGDARSADWRTAFLNGQLFGIANPFGFNGLWQNPTATTLPLANTYNPWTVSQPINQSVPQALTQPFAQSSSVPGMFGTFPFNRFVTPHATEYQVPYGPSDVAATMPSNFGQFGRVPAWTNVSGLAPQGQAQQTLPGRSPAINIWEDDANLCVEAEVPGVSLDDVELQIADRTLHLRTGRLLSHSQAEQQRRLIHGERVPGGFSRVIHLPTEIDGEKVEAKLNNGVLRLTLPKLNAQQRRTIRVNQVTTA